MTTLEQATRRRRAVTAALAAALVAVAGLVTATPASAKVDAPWTSTVIATPPVLGDVALTAMSCVTATRCVAVGSAGGSTDPRPLVETLAGTTWTTTTPPAPAGAASASLTGVSCTTVGSCVAVGDESLATGAMRGYADTLADGAWHAVTLPGALTGGGAVTLAAVDCPVAGSCTAVGEQHGAVDVTGVVETLAGGTWHTAELVSDTDVTMGAVSCPTATSCTAVGSESRLSGTTYRDRTNVVIEALQQGKWQEVFDTNPDSAHDAALTSVSCATATACTAVGDVTASDGTVALVESGAGSAWAATTALSAPASASGTTLSGVSCLSPDHCSAVGAYTLPGGSSRSYAATFAGGDWATSAHFDPPGVTAAALTSVVCPPAALRCDAGGYAVVGGRSEALAAYGELRPAVALVVRAPASATVGQPVPVNVTAVDSAGATVPGYDGTVALTSSDPAAALSGPAMLRDGVGELTVTFGTAGPQTVTATDTADPDISGTSAPVTVLSPVELTVTAPASGTVGHPVVVTARAVTPSGGTVTSDDDPLVVTSSDAAAVLPDGVALVGGTQTFAVTFATAGTQTVTVTDGDDPSTTATSPPIEVTAAPAPPSPPSGLFATGLPDSIDLRWSRPSGSERDPVSEYVVSCTSGSGAASRVVATTTATTFVDAAGLVPATTYTFVVRAVDAAGTSAPSNPASASLVRTASGGRLFSATPDGGGYWTTTPSGVVTAHGDARPEGSLRGPVDRPVVSMASTPGGAGYWLVASDGGIFSFGDATFHGSLGAIRLDQPIVGMAATPDGLGYWLVASDGGIFAFGDATFHGSLGAIRLDQPIVGMAATPDGLGYWLVASDGGIFSFGDATFHGSLGAVRLDQPIVGMAATPDGLGYWLVASDGGVFCFGDARYAGSLGGQPIPYPIVGMAAGPGGGYSLVDAAGRAVRFG